MIRGKWLRQAIIVVSVVTAAAFVSGFDGCGKKPEGATGPSRNGGSSQSTETTKPKSQEPQDRPSPGKMIVTLYFSDANAEKLVAEKREIPKTPAIAKVIIEELIKGPRDVGLYPTLPKQLKLLSVKMKGATAVVDLSNVRKAGYGGTAAEMMIVYSIVDSLTELPNVKQVQFLVDGKKRDVLIDAFDITDPVERDERLIAK